MSRPLRLFGLLVVAMALLPIESAAADPYKVTSTANDGGGTLRQAILDANSHPGADTIPIEVMGTINLQSALQIIFDPVSIVGPGADQLEVRGAGAAGFTILAFSTDADPSSLTGLTVSNGQAALGGGIRNVEGSLTLTRVVVRGNEAVAEGGTDAVVEGGGVFSEGPLTLRESVVAGNTARASNGTSRTEAVGGGVAALSALTVERSTISGNLAEATGGGGLARARGGGLLTPELTAIELSTISGNSANAEGGGTLTRAEGGGVDAYEGGLTSSTVTGNSATSSGEAFGANLDSFFTTVVRDTIVSDPGGDADSCNGEIASGGFNLDEDGSCEFGQGTDQDSVMAGLGPLAPYGGPTPTHPLSPNSPALDRGSAFGSGLDQRGLPRPFDFTSISNAEGGDGSDIGAFELQPPPAAGPALVSALPADRTPPNTRIVSGPSRLGYKHLAKFRFASTEPQSTFQCKLDRKAWRGCANPVRRVVKSGKHLFWVRAIDRFGNVDPTPARFGWRVKPIAG